VQIKRGNDVLATYYYANGNQTTRTVGGQTYTLSYDAESRLVSVSGAVSATFVYDGDGNRVTSTIGTTNTVYIGGYFEWSGSSSSMKMYYYAGGQRIAMRLGTTTLRFILGDHLGSTAITATTSGSKLAELRYYPWGGVRYTYGTTPSDYRFTGQQEVASIGLYFYNARWYDSSLGRFVQADSIIPNPEDPPSFDRFAYVRNNPIKYFDPSGHNLNCGQRGSHAAPEDCAEVTATGSTSGTLGTPLHEWEIFMLIATVMSETSNGTYPDYWIKTIAWVFLNRLTLGMSDSLLDAVKGVQSAFICYYQGCNGKPALFPKSADESWEAYIGRLKEAWGSGEAWTHVGNLVQEVYNNWLVYGTQSIYDLARGATNFVIKYPPERAQQLGDATYPDDPSMANIYTLGINQVEGVTTYTSWENSTPTFHWFALGPAYISYPLDETIYLFVSNFSLAYPVK
jgi:RHS repeat-associated protein